MTSVPERLVLPADNAALFLAVERRDPTYDGLFYTCVKTTGIFCRPTCPARRPLRQNVEFVPNVQAALLAGYRPCKVCRPMDAPDDAPPWVRELAERVRRHPHDVIKERALRDMGLDPDHVRRQFHRHYAMTFSAYQRALRLGLAMRTLRQGGSATAAALDAGYTSASAFRDAFGSLFGVSPGDARDSEPLIASWLSTPLGPMLAIASDAGLCLLEFVDRRSIETQISTVRTRTGRVVIPGQHPLLDRIERELVAYFADGRSPFSVPLDPQGTDFERSVWIRLLRVPAGETASYAQIARDINNPGAARAIGRANGSNRIAIVIPCHRVVRADGSLCGYGGGVDRKRWLLTHEGALAPLYERAP